MLSRYKSYLSKYLDLDSVSDEELNDALEQLGRDIVFNYLVFGKDVPFEIFLNNLAVYLGIDKRFSCKNS